MTLCLSHKFYIMLKFEPCNILKLLLGFSYSEPEYSYKLKSSKKCVLNPIKAIYHQ